MANLKRKNGHLVRTTSNPAHLAICPPECNRPGCTCYLAKDVHQLVTPVFIHLTLVSNNLVIGPNPNPTFCSGFWPTSGTCGDLSGSYGLGGFTYGDCAYDCESWLLVTGGPALGFFVKLSAVYRENGDGHFVDVNITSGVSVGKINAEDYNNIIEVGCSGGGIISQCSQEFTYYRRILKFGAPNVEFTDQCFARVKCDGFWDLLDDQVVLNAPNNHCNPNYTVQVSR